MSDEQEREGHEQDQDQDQDSHGHRWGGTPDTGSAVPPQGAPFAGPLPPPVDQEVEQTAQPAQLQTPPEGAAVGHIGLLREGSGMVVLLGWALRIYLIVVAVVLGYTGLSLLGVDGVDGLVTTGSFVLAIGVAIPVFYAALVRERDRQRFVRLITEAEDVTVSFRDKDKQAIVYSSSVAADRVRTKRNWLVWGIATAVILVVGAWMLTAGLENSDFSLVPGGLIVDELDRGSTTMRST